LHEKKSRKVAKALKMGAAELMADTEANLHGADYYQP